MRILVMLVAGLSCILMAATQAENRGAAAGAKSNVPSPLHVQDAGRDSRPGAFFQDSGERRQAF